MTTVSLRGRPESGSCITAAMPRASVTTLKRVPLFAGLDERDLEQIADVMQERHFEAGSTVTREGAAGVGFFIVEQGEAEVTIAGEPRRRIGPGDYFGEIALLTDSPRTATITASTELMCYGMTPWDFKPLVETNSAIAWKLLTTMAERLR